MSTKKEIWRLLEAGEVWQKGDQYFNGSIESWENSTSRIWGSPAGHYDKPARRRMTLPEPQGWISVKERMPTKEDADDYGRVIWLRTDGAVYTERWNGKATWYHGWLPIPPIPKKPKDPDEEAWEKAWPDLQRTSYSEEAAKAAFMAGRKSVTTEGGSHA